MIVCETDEFCSLIAISADFCVEEVAPLFLDKVIDAYTLAMGKEKHAALNLEVVKDLNMRLEEWLL